MSNAGFNLAGVCGWPIHHSLSPVIHNYWLREMGLGGAYVAFAVRPDEAVRAFRSLKKTSITGVNVTIPLKQQAFEAADDATIDAKTLGVANCLFKRDGRLIAHNSDLRGFAEPLIKRLGADYISQVPVMIIGAGGAARAAVGALLALGCPEIRICARNPQKSQGLADEFSVPSLHHVLWEDRHDALAPSAVMVNATSAGMKSYPPLDLDLSSVRGTDIFIYDLVYTPQLTPLLQDAKEQGLSYLGGLDMLIAQARPAFKLFYGQVPPADLDPTQILLKELNGLNG